MWMNGKKRVLIIIGIIFIVGTIGVLLGYYYTDSLQSPIVRKDMYREPNGEVNETFPPPPEFQEEIDRGRENLEIYIVIKTAITLINIVISTILIFLYLKIYQEVKSDFTFGLIIVMFAMLLYAITSNPLIQFLFSFRGFGQGPFILIPDIFATIALSVLLYLSLK
jgi:hypothetical protein